MASTKKFFSDIKTPDSTSAGVLVSLNGNDMQNQYINSEDINDSVFTYKRNKVTKSNFTYIYENFKKSQINNTYSVSINSNCDLIGQTYLEFNYHTYDNLNEIIQDIAIDIGGQTIEKLSGDILHIYNQDNDVYYGNKYVIPLNFFYTESSDLYLKATALGFHEIRFIVTFLTEVQNIKLVYQGINVTEQEQKSIRSKNHFNNVIIKNSNVISVQDTKTNQIKTVSTELFLNGLVKDILLYVKPKNDIVEPIKNIKVKLNYNTIINLDNVMSRYIIPRDLYGINNNELIYYIPFDIDTTEVTTVSNVNMSRINNIILELDIEDGDYDITIINKRINFARYQAGMFCLAFTN